MSDAELLTEVQNTFWARAMDLLFHHTNPWELDEALTGWGYTLGPCEAMDLVGLDVVLSRLPDTGNPVLARMVAEGRLGKKGGWGFYRYPGGGGAVIDPLIEDLIREEAWFASQPRAALDDAALVAAMDAVLNGDHGLLEKAVHYPFPSKETGRSL